MAWRVFLFCNIFLNAALPVIMDYVRLFEEAVIARRTTDKYLQNVFGRSDVARGAIFKLRAGHRMWQVPRTERKQKQRAQFISRPAKLFCLRVEKLS
jgi:aspartyl/asparaginyl beta-hydroxylase (cupin superfamily)